MEPKRFSEAAKFFSRLEKRANETGGEIPIPLEERFGRHVANANIAVGKLNSMRASLQKICLKDKPVIDEESLNTANTALNEPSHPGKIRKYDSNTYNCIARACIAVKIVFEEKY